MSSESWGVLIRLVLFGLTGLPCIAAAAAAPAAPVVGTEQHAWKLTVGEYVYADYVGTDVNLRWRRDDTSAWLGVYTDQAFGTQTRMGADTSIDVSRYVQLQPSLQLASLGFVGGSLNVQAGDAWYGIVGIGRTNTRPYFNLNFDPNDALTFGAGHHAANGAGYLLFIVADDRLHTQQRDWHFNARIPFGNSHATLDLLRKSGLTDAGPITAWGLSATWDWPAWFVRVAYDPYQNFSLQTAWRLAAGVRF
jgi:hypothetical protein